MKNQPKVNIVDAPCGAGKTSLAIQMMNKQGFANSKYIYITPFLDEVARVKKSVTNRKFHEPKNIGKGKMDSLKRLIIQQKDIVSTHALFKMADPELIQLLKSNNYTLILDEVMSVIEQFVANKDDFQYLIDKKSIEIDKHGYVVWIEDKKYEDTQFNEIKNLANSRNLVVHRDSVLMWTFPVSCFEAFNEVFILTYMFKAQYQRYYYDLHELKYKYYSVDKVDGSDEYKLVDYDAKRENTSHFKDLINIYEGKLNVIGDENSLSSTWLRDSKNELKVKQIQKNLCNYFNKIENTKSNFCMWTTLKHARSKLQGKGYTKGFLEHTARATNEYSERYTLAYAMNKFMMPMEKGYFDDKGITINEDDWSLSELIQWVWRSAIRNNKPINIYIPSKRMRKLLTDWLNK